MTTMGAHATGLEGFTRKNGNNRRAQVSFCAKNTRRRNAIWTMTRTVDLGHHQFMFIFIFTFFGGDHPG
jgi:hypothetical protein